MPSRPRKPSNKPEGATRRPATPAPKGRETAKKSAPRAPANPTNTLWDNPNEPIRINRYIASSGYCSRRKADELIAAGKVLLNGQVVREMGEKVLPGKDKVVIEGKVIEAERPIYILMNKPKNTITTLSDPEGRQCVGDLVKDKLPQRVYPVGRLDRNTTGILLLTNDGELAKRLTHPRYNVRKVYHVELFTPLTPEHLEKMRAGLELEDGFIKPDKIDYIDNQQGPRIGIQLHSGRNRIVRRMFEFMGYEVKNLDRVAFGPIDVKGTKRGTWRLLNSAEIAQLRRLK